MHRVSGDVMSGAKQALDCLMQFEAVAPRLNTRDRSVVLSLLSQRLGWVPLAAVRESLPQFSQVDFSRALAKLAAEESPLIKTRQVGRNKELRLTGNGVRVGKRMESLLLERPLVVEPLLESVGSLPPTSRDHYLTGKAALNIPSKEGTGDWHFQEIFRGGEGHKSGPFPIAGTDLLSTHHIFGRKGIVERSRKLREMGLDIQRPLYVASHPRAMADMIYSALKSGRAFEKSYTLSDWFPADRDRCEVLAFMERMKPYLTDFESRRLRAWIEK